MKLLLSLLLLAALAHSLDLDLRDKCADLCRKKGPGPHLEEGCVCVPEPYDPKVEIEALRRQVRALEEIVAALTQDVYGADTELYLRQGRQ